MTAIEFPECSLSFSTAYPCFNSLEVKMDPLYKKSLYLEQTLAYRINIEINTPYAGDSGILLSINVKLTIEKLKSSRLS